MKERGSILGRGKDLSIRHHV